MTRICTSRSWGVAAMGLALLAAAGASAADAPVTRPVVSEEACPLTVITARASDGETATAVVRRPPGKGPFPALVHLHGGLEPVALERLKHAAQAGETQGRFLAAGYLIAEATFRSRSQDPLTPVALRDCVAIVETIRTLPDVDPRSVVVWGDSGGGSLALELAGEIPLCAIVAQEPATVLFTGMYSPANLRGKPPYSAGSGQHIMDDPQRYYTPELQERTRAKIQKIGCPILIARGDIHSINKLNEEIFVPELKQAGKHVEVIVYPGERHGFSNAGTPRATLKFFNDADAFFRRYLATRPTPVEAALIKQVPVAR